MKKISNKNNFTEAELEEMKEMEEMEESGGSEAPEAPEAPVASREEPKEDREAGERAVKLLRSALKSASEGISKGISADFASKRDVSSIFHDIAEVVTAPITMTRPSRELEKGIRDISRLTKANDQINLEAKVRLEQGIISPSLQLYSSNFAPFISVLDKIPALTKDLKPLNDITNIEAMAIEFKGKDVSITNFSEESPYKIIIKQIIPILREKFDAVASFDQALGSGTKIDYEGLSIEREEDVAELQRFYKAIVEWVEVMKAFQESTDNTTGLASTSVGSKNTGDEKARDSDEEDVSEDNTIADNIYIHAVRPGQYVHRDPTGANGIYIDNHALDSEDTPVVKLYIKGEGADNINSSGSGEAYLRHFVNKGKITLLRGIDLSKIIYNVTRESVSGGSEVTIYFRADGIKDVRGRTPERIEIMRISTNRGDIPIFIDDAYQLRALERAASTETTPYYKAKSPSGETVFFTPSDLVISGGKIKDSKGNKFKPKNITGESLAKRVTSKGYGKVRT